MVILTHIEYNIEINGNFKEEFMYEYIEGKVTVKKIDYVAIDINGVAYKLYISLKTYEKIEKEVEKLYVYTYVREDILKLYGFYSEDERTLFEIMLNANGVGPKIAVAILSAYSVSELRDIIMDENEKLLSKVPGIGVKKAQKLILDIKDKISKLSIENREENLMGIQSEIELDIMLAMESLGYGAKDLEKFVSKEEMKSYTSKEEAIKEILKKIRK